MSSYGYTAPVTATQSSGDFTVKGGDVIGSDAQGDTKLNLEDSRARIIVDNAVKLDAQATGVTMIEPLRSVANTDSPVTCDTADQFILVDASSGSVVINLPSAATAGSGRSYHIKSKGSHGGNSVTVTRANAGHGNIDGGASIALENFSAVCVISDGSNWWVY